MKKLFYLSFSFIFLIIFASPTHASLYNCQIQNPEIVDKLPVEVKITHETFSSTIVKDPKWVLTIEQTNEKQSSPITIEETPNGGDFFINEIQFKIGDSRISTAGTYKFSFNGYNAGQDDAFVSCDSEHDTTVTDEAFSSSESEPTPPPPSPPCSNFDENGKCLEVATAIGPISTDPAGFVSNIFAIVLSISGGIAILIILYSGYRLMMSQGNPETIKLARDRLTSAIVGLLFIIFSIVILEVIGVDILHIPGFDSRATTTNTIKTGQPQ